MLADTSDIFTIPDPDSRDIMPTNYQLSLT